MEESEQKLQSSEQNYQLQLGSTRATLELVKEQLKREAAELTQTLHDNHRRQLGMLNKQEEKSANAEVLDYSKIIMILYVLFKQNAL